MTTKSTGTAARTVKLTVSLSHEVVSALQQMAADEGTSVTEQLRRAISTQKWLHDVRKQRGARVLIQEPGAEMKEIVFLT